MCFVQISIVCEKKPTFIQVVYTGYKSKIIELQYEQVIELYCQFGKEKLKVKNGRVNII